MTQTKSQTPMKQYWAGKSAPEHADAWFNFHKTVSSNGVLDQKTKELISIAVGNTARCSHCVKAHIKDAFKAGATKNEVAEAIMVSASIGSGANIFWNSKDFEELLGDSE